MFLATHRDVVARLVQAHEPRAVVTLAGNRWTVAIPLGEGSKVSVGFPGAPVEDFAWKARNTRPRALAAFLGRWERRARMIHERACLYRSELAATAGQPA